MNFVPWTTQLRVLEQMLKDRSYKDIRIIGTGVDPSLIFSCQDTDDTLVLVYMTNETKVGVKSLRKLCDETVQYGSKHLLLLCPDGLTPFANKELGKFDKDELDVEIFRKDEMHFSLPRHYLVPPHIALTPTEKKVLLTQLGATKASACLPRLKQNDPIAKYYHFPVGTVVRIQRRIGTLESETYFRLVVA